MNYDTPHYYGAIHKAGRYAIVAVSVHKTDGRFTHTTQRETGELFNTASAAEDKVASLNGCDPLGGK